MGSREESRTRKGQALSARRRTSAARLDGRGVVQPVLAQVHPGEDHFPVAQAGQLMKGRQHRGGVQAAAGAPDLGHDAVAALVAAALLDLEPGPGVAGNGWTSQGWKGGAAAKSSTHSPGPGSPGFSDLWAGNHFLPLPGREGAGGRGINIFTPTPALPHQGGGRGIGRVERPGVRRGSAPLPDNSFSRWPRRPFSWLPKTACTPGRAATSAGARCP